MLQVNHTEIMAQSFDDVQDIFRRFNHSDLPRSRPPLIPFRLLTSAVPNEKNYSSNPPTSPTFGYEFIIG